MYPHSSSSDTWSSYARDSLNRYSVSWVPSPPPIRSFDTLVGGRQPEDDITILSRFSRLSSTGSPKRTAGFGIGALTHSESSILKRVIKFAITYFKEIIFAAMSLVALAFTPGAFLIGGALGLTFGTLVDKYAPDRIESWLSKKVIEQYFPESLQITAKKAIQEISFFVYSILLTAEVRAKAAERLDKPFDERFVTNNQVLVQALNVLGTLNKVPPFGFLAGFQVGVVIGREFLANKVNHLFHYFQNLREPTFSIPN